MTDVAEMIDGADELADEALDRMASDIICRGGCNICFDVACKSEPVK